MDQIIIIEPCVLDDVRGYFFQPFSLKEFDREICPIRFVQENESCSAKNVVRGLHYQNPPYSQAKLVRCVRGRIISLALDMRRGSTTFGKCFQNELTEKNKFIEFIPHGFAHGFISLEDNTIVQYKCDNYYNKEEMCGINVFDPAMNITFPFSKEEAVVSEVDMLRPSFKDVISPFY